MSNKAQTTIMKSETKRELKPKLRFTDFREAPGWEEKKLGAIASFYKGKGVSKAEIDHNGKHPCIRYGELYTRYGEVIESVYSRTSVSTSDLFLSRKNDVIIPASGETKLDIAKASCVMCDDVALGGDINVIRTDHNGVFLSYYLNGPKKLDIAKVAQGHTVVHLYPSQLEQLAIVIPKRAEQLNIADCLSSVDELIAAQTQKLDALKTHKKGLKQQLFPREGETQPCLHFPEFRNAPEWEEKEIGEVFKVTRGEVLSMTLVQDEKTSEAQYPVYSSQTTKSGLSGYYSDYLYENAITWTTDGANAGDVNYRAGRFYCTNVCGVLINTDGYANPCVAALINSVSRKHVSYVGNPKLMNGVMAKITIPFPTIEEQHKIANCLSSLDGLITAQTQKLDALKAHKKGLMQQLFPSLEDSQ